jgi:hypothetical protein
VDSGVVREAEFSRRAVDKQHIFVSPVPLNQRRDEGSGVSSISTLIAPAGGVDTNSHAARGRDRPFTWWPPDLEKNADGLRPHRQTSHKGKKARRLKGEKHG